jgi:hypothetical protein
MLANHICHMQWILERVINTQKSQCSEQATADLPDSLMHAGHSEPRNVDVWAQHFKNRERYTIIKCHVHIVHKTISC